MCEFLKNYEIILKICIGVIILIYLLRFIHFIRVKSKIRRLAKNALEVTPKEFFNIRKSAKREFEGVYIIYNHTKNMYYVGQSQRVFQRVNNHFTGHGNGDVYADYKYEDDFTIRMIALKHSGFKTLNELERNTIKTYDAYSNGYNKTRGNKG